VQFRFERAITNPFGCRQSFVGKRYGAVDVACTGLGFSKGNLDESVEDQGVLLAKIVDALAHSLESIGERSGVDSRPAFEKNTECAERSQIALANNPSQIGHVHLSPQMVTAHQCEQRGVHCARSDDVGLCKDPDSSSHMLNERDRAFDLAKRPRGKRQVSHGGGASVLNDSQRQVVVAPGLKQCYRTFEVLLRFEEFSGEPVGDALHAMRDTDFGRNGSPLNVREHGRGVRPHPRQLAAHVAADPQAGVGREPSGRVLVTNRRLAGSGEGFCRLRRSGSARSEQRVALRDV